jgi:hypothetical protein
MLKLITFYMSFLTWGAGQLADTACYDLVTCASGCHGYR